MNGIRAAGLGVVALSLVSLLYFATIFEISIETKSQSTLVPARVANLERLNARQNGVIVSSAGAIVGVLMFLFGGNVTRASDRAVRTVGAGKECPECRLINPASAERCDCGYVFAASARSSSR